MNGAPTRGPNVIEILQRLEQEYERVAVAANTQADGATPGQLLQLVLLSSRMMHAKLDILGMQVASFQARAEEREKAKRIVIP